MKRSQVGKWGNTESAPRGFVSAVSFYGEGPRTRSSMTKNMTVRPKAWPNMQSAAAIHIIHLFTVHTAPLAGPYRTHSLLSGGHRVSFCLCGPRYPWVTSVRAGKGPDKRKHASHARAPQAGSAGRVYRAGGNPAAWWKRGGAGSSLYPDSGGGDSTKEMTYTGTQWVGGRVECLCARGELLRRVECIVLISSDRGEEGACVAT